MLDIVGGQTKLERVWKVCFKRFYILIVHRAKSAHDSWRNPRFFFIHTYKHMAQFQFEKLQIVCEWKAGNCTKLEARKRLPGLSNRGLWYVKPCLSLVLIFRKRQVAFRKKLSISCFFFFWMRMRNKPQDCSSRKHSWRLQNCCEYHQSKAWLTLSNSLTFRE